ncbi:Phosphorelay intermediate protein [Microbotryomycetes sp. JL201]|nr:Phosphorelay intermediate protein [Microbotryomycetes sp. JL201]
MATAATSASANESTTTKAGSTSAHRATTASHVDNDAAPSTTGASTKLNDGDDATTTKEAQDGSAAAPIADDAGESSGQIVDMDVFGQLLEIDDDESHEFSKTLAFDYISQADATFQEIEDALQARDLDTLSRKGHFLKGSSAALGLQRVQRTCEQMQHVGQRKDESGDHGELLSEDEALKRSRALLERVKREQEEAKEWLEAFFKA